MTSSDLAAFPAVKFQSDFKTALSPEARVIL
ncbi:hypothetical protein LYNGBM3L_21440 [Moorena producens 3L]|uniref:Uncharacterized protein n=1 Tax=Moorena producens 3L TaxID=489825 RepID=F4XNC6_9CYAN|nr:hypothetical protein LYNGBM3L_21440 [Moorena producens 3L]